MFRSQIAGRLTRDPRLIESNGVVTGVSLGIADNQRWTDRASGEQRESTTFVNIDCWDTSFAANIMASLHTGDFILVDGDMRANEFEIPATETEPLTKVRGLVCRARFIGPDLRFQSAPVTRNERNVDVTPAQLTELEAALALLTDEQRDALKAAVAEPVLVSAVEEL